MTAATLANTTKETTLVFDLRAGTGVSARLETHGDIAIITFETLDDLDLELSESFVRPKDALCADLSLLAALRRLPDPDEGLGYISWEALGVTLTMGCVGNDGRTLYIEMDPIKGAAATICLPLDMVLCRLGAENSHHRP
jgi:hypothetical protein